MEIKYWGVGESWGCRRGEPEETPGGKAPPDPKTDRAFLFENGWGERRDDVCLFGQAPSKGNLWGIEPRDGDLGGNEWGLREKPGSCMVVCRSSADFFDREKAVGA